MFIYIYKTCKWSYPIQNDNVSLDVVGYFECDNAEEIIFSGPRSSLWSQIVTSSTLYQEFRQISEEKSQYPPIGALIHR